MTASTKRRSTELYLEVVKGLNPGALYRLDKPSMILGRSEDCDIVIPQRQISATHCRFTINGPEVSVEDFGSSNGTYLDEILMTGAETLTQNSRLLVGHTVLRIVRRSSEEVRREQQWFEGATTDILTGVPTQAMFRQAAEYVLPLARRRKWCVSLLLFDVDHFHAVNVKHGLSAADEVIRELGLGLRDTLRSEDLLARFGEEMFVALLLDTRLEDAMNIADRERMRIASKRFRDGDNIFSVTVSAGATACEDRSELTLDRLIQEADDALFRAKEEGRNRVCGALVKKREAARTDTTITPPGA